MQSKLRALNLTIRVLCNKADTVPRRESIREFYNYPDVLTLKTAQFCGFMHCQKITHYMKFQLLFYFDSIVIFLNKITQYFININL